MKPKDPMESFLQGYRGESSAKDEVSQKTPTKTVKDVIDLLAKAGPQTMTMFEISSLLIVPNQTAAELVQQLAGLKLVSVTPGERGNHLVALTDQGRASASTGH